jgi:uncharacterized membrane protein YeaQ/YmgE (transglycosylase-associated protein family)
MSAAQRMISRRPIARARQARWQERLQARNSLGNGCREFLRPAREDSQVMPDPDISQAVQTWFNEAFVWIGFGTVSGLLAKAIMPGRDPGGAVATLGIGIGGAVVGCGILSFFVPEYRVSPLTPVGFVVATGGAFLLLFFYRLLAGYVIREDGEGYIPRPYFGRREYRGRRPPVYQERTYRD